MEKNFRVSIETETWSREACELIDYDSNNLIRNSFEIKKTCYLYRKGNEVESHETEIQDKNCQKLLKITDNGTYFDITRNNIEKSKNGNISSPNPAWFLLKLSKMDPKFDKYKIHQGEIIKIGRIITRIREIKYDKKNKNDKDNNNENSLIDSSKYSNKFKLRDVDDEALIINKRLNPKYTEKVIDMANQRNATDSDFQDKIDILFINKKNNSKTIPVNDDNQKTISFEKKKKKKEKVCRICYIEEEDENEDPIVQPCHCSGSCRYIHLKCLKKWLMNKSCLKVDNNEICSVFLFTESECELCKMKLPDFVNHKGKLISLLDFSDEFKNYFILESLTLDKENNKFLYIISLDKSREIKVGRGQCDILLSDVSVSRIHCFFLVEGKNLYIQDNDSKFGTLILMQAQSLILTENLPLNIQVGRSYLNITIRKKQKFFECCGVSENPNIYYYYNQNKKQLETDRCFTVKTEGNNDDDDIGSDDDDEGSKSEINIDESKRNDNIEEIINKST